MAARTAVMNSGCRFAASCRYWMQTPDSPQKQAPTNATTRPNRYRVFLVFADAALIHVLSCLPVQREWFAFSTMLCKATILQAALCKIRVNSCDCRRRRQQDAGHS